MKLNTDISSAKSSERRGDWIATYSGQKFFPFDPRIEEIDINDISHSLSNLCRFGGHCSTFYSVGQHSVLVSLMSAPEDALWGLLHDASEAYLVDVPSPLKKMPEFAAYRVAEKKLQEVICQTFGLPSEEPDSVSIADKRILATEARDLTFTQGRGWSTTAWPYDFSITPWTPEHTRVRFMRRLHELTRKI